VKPIWGFSENLFADMVEVYVQADEPERGLWVLDNLPSWYRDNPPPRLKKLKKEILSALITPRGYMQSNLDDHVRVGEAAKYTLEGLLRGKLIIEAVKKQNEKGITPHVIDMGPGEYFIPNGLKELGCSFTYEDIGMDQCTRAATQDLVRTKATHEYTIFVANELIEHLASPLDMAIEAHTHSNRLDEIHLSTPLYTFDTQYKEWRKPNGLPHLRTYTPTEFIAAAVSVFPGYAWELTNDGDLQSLVGKKHQSTHN
jgi:hypothetical protein